MQIISHRNGLRHWAKVTKKGEITISISIPVDGISRILIFQTKEEFEGTLLENPQLVPLIGHKEMHKQLLRVYIAGFKDKADSEGTLHEAN